MKFWNFRDTEAGRVLDLDGPIAEETWWGDEVTPQMFRDELEAQVGDITVNINSPGGDVFAAAQMYNMLRAHRGKVKVTIDSLAASAASVVAMAGDEVEISPVGMLMIHNPATFTMGDHRDIENTLRTLNEVKESIINAYQTKTGLSRRELSDLMDAETWMNANKALEKGFVDRISGEGSKDKAMMFERRTNCSDTLHKIVAKLDAEKAAPPLDEPKAEDEGTPVKEILARLDVMHQMF